MRTTIQFETSVRGAGAASGPPVTCDANLAHVSKAWRVNHESFYGMAILGRPYFTRGAFPAFRRRALWEIFAESTVKRAFCTPHDAVYRQLSG